MANRNFPSQRIYNMHMMAVQLDGVISIGASGAPTIQSALGIASITRLSAGRYQIQLQDNYVKLLGLDCSFISPVSGSNVTAGSFSVGTVYQITAVGTTNFNAIGLPSGVVAAAGVVFKASGAGSGTGTAKVIGASGISSVEIMDNSANALQNNNSSPLLGGYINIQCLAPTSSSDTTPIPADPANGSSMVIKILLSNSSVQ